MVVEHKSECESDIDLADELFLPPVASWFSRRFGSPTPPQTLGWPVIAAGRSALIVSPTGSGKTLAAFLAGLDHLWRQPQRSTGVGILYISPLKALNEDVHRNLTVPLEGILAEAEEIGYPLRPLTAAVRSGDTKPNERARLVRKPPDVLITTPESLHLMLTSRARETLRGISHVIVDEIHAVCGNKRGVFLALLLERLERLNPSGFVRVGLSATQRPLDEVARYLGGRRLVGSGEGGPRFEPRPVTVVDAGSRRNLDLSVLWPDDRSNPEAASIPSNSIWPKIEAELLRLAVAHRSTIIFANNRRTVEKLAAKLNELARDDDPTNPPSFRAHHGSLNLDERRATEGELKRGELAAVVATASLELGIDVEAVDLVCQVESPGSVARGLQRVGRAGHVVGGTGKGVLIAKTPGDLLESAALCRAMLNGEVEHLRVPSNCLDVLAQQMVAAVAVERWDVPDLFNLARSAYPYRDLTAEAFESVLKLISGRFQGDDFRDLKARVVWDPVHNRLAPLPGTSRLALAGGGAITDTGQYPVYLGVEGPRLGELDEEFVYERRVGEAFLLGNATWTIEAIDPHRVIVRRAEGGQAVVPFWRGENAPRSPELARAIGEVSREVRDRLDDPARSDWLKRECRLDDASAKRLVGFVRRQFQHAGAVPDDRTILVESFRDPVGELGLAVLTGFGGKVNHGLKLALQAKIRERFGIKTSCLHGDEGILVRLPGMDDAPLDLLHGLTGDRAESLIREELADSALFGLRFRQNAARAMLMPRPDPAKRTPLWLQRLRAKDLLQIALRFPDFPIVIETYRECLDDDLDMPRLKAVLDDVQSGTVRVETRQGEVPSPFASGLVFRFTAAFLYQWDEPRRADRRPAGSPVDAGLLDRLLRDGEGSHLLDPRAVDQVDAHLRGGGLVPRSPEEMAEFLRRIGDLTYNNATGNMAGHLAELEAEGRAKSIDLDGGNEPDRWIPAELEAEYKAAFPLDGKPDPAVLEAVVRRYLRTHALIGLAELTARYPIDVADATDLLERWAAAGGISRIAPADDSTEPRWIERTNLEEVRRASLAIRRRETAAVPPEAFADFLTRLQHIHPTAVWRGAECLESAIEQFQGYPAAPETWETEILPRRVLGYQPGWLDDLLATGGWCWRAAGEGSGSLVAAFADRGFSGAWPPLSNDEELSSEAAMVLEELERTGARFVADLSRGTGLEPSRVRVALLDLAARGAAANDRFEPLRARARGETASQAASFASLRAAVRPGRARPPRRGLNRPEGRWSVLDRPEPDADASLRAWSEALLGRYGVLTREIVALDPWAPSWGDLARWLARAEWRGEVRRGYFVEGLSGVQYAHEDAVEALAAATARNGRSGDEEDVFLAAIDPANVYGSGAPFDIPLLDGGTARFSRIPGNSLVLNAGRPVLIVEAHGKRLTGLASASLGEIESALRHLPSLAHPGRRVLKIETYNGVAASACPITGRLAKLGFVRDYPGMTYYLGMSG